MYVPAIGRIRKLVTPEAFTAFLNSDFTFADLGFVDLRAAYTLVGTEDVSGKKAYRVQAVPKQQWYYTKIVTLVDAGTFMPIERSYYDVAGQLWKTQRWEQPRGHQRRTHVPEHQDRRRAGRRRTRISPYYRPALRRDGSRRAAVTPEGLINAAGAPVWKSLAATRSRPQPRPTE